MRSIVTSKGLKVDPNWVKSQETMDKLGLLYHLCAKVEHKIILLGKKNYALQWWISDFTKGALTPGGR